VSRDSVVIAAAAGRDILGVAPTRVRKQTENMVLSYCFCKLKNGQMFIHQ